MTIDTIHYSRKMSDGNYGNLELGMHAQLQDIDDPAQAASDLRAAVDGLLGQERERHAQEQAVSNELYDLQMKLEHKQRDLERMAERWAQAKAFLEQHGVDTGRYSDNPF